MKGPITISLTLHLTIAVLALLAAPNGTGNGTGNGNSANQGEKATGDAAGNNTRTGDIKEHPTSVTVMQITPDVQKALKALEHKIHPPKTVKHIDKCPYFYGGIGVYETFNTITKIMRGYPGDKVGLNIGDVMLDDVLGIPGQPLTFRVLRNGMQLTFHTTREKICVTH